MNQFWISICLLLAPYIFVIFLKVSDFKCRHLLTFDRSELLMIYITLVLIEWVRKRTTWKRICHFLWREKIFSNFTIGVVLCAFLCTMECRTKSCNFIILIKCLRFVNEQRKWADVACVCAANLSKTNVSYWSDILWKFLNIHGFRTIKLCRADVYAKLIREIL